MFIVCIASLSFFINIQCIEKVYTYQKHISRLVKRFLCIKTSKTKIHALLI